MRWVFIVFIIWWRKVYFRLGLRIGGCGYIILLIYYENIILRDGFIKGWFCNRRKKMLIKGLSYLMLLKI